MTWMWGDWRKQRKVMAKKPRTKKNARNVKVGCQPLEKEAKQVPKVVENLSRALHAVERDTRRGCARP